MKNKDVECAIADLVTYCNEHDSEVMYDFEYETITNYVEQLEKEVEELIKCVDDNEKAHLFFTNNQVEIIQKMKKAIDKACEQLEKYSNYITELNGENEDMTKEQWKEWSFKNE